MKNIFLVGDSIRFGAPNASKYNNVSPGYERYVKEKLADIANVYGPDENCRFAQFTLRFLQKWAAAVPAEEIDIVHWNNGLWDVLRLFGDEPLTPMEFYENMLRRIYKRIRFLFPNAKIIFALSTAVIEERELPEFVRYNHEIEEYNKKAREIMEELGVEVNDLYSITSAFEHSLYADAVHFNEEGSKVLADVVIKACLPELK